MTWYGENRSGREEPWTVGDLVRYDDGPTALMRITHVHTHGMATNDRRGIACEVHYYGRAFHSHGPCTSRYHGQCEEPIDDDRARWAACHDADDWWIRGAWGTMTTVSDAA